MNSSDVFVTQYRYQDQCDAPKVWTSFEMAERYLLGLLRTIAPHHHGYWFESIWRITPDYRDSDGTVEFRYTASAVVSDGHAYFNVSRQKYDSRDVKKKAYEDEPQNCQWVESFPINPDTNMTGVTALEDPSEEEK